jgi:hypothetical protein
MSTPSPGGGGRGKSRPPGGPCGARPGPARRPLLLARSRTFCFSSQGQRTINGTGEPLTGSERDRRHLSGRPSSHPQAGSGRQPPRSPAARTPPSLRGRGRSDPFGASWARLPRVPLPRAPTPARAPPGLSRGRPAPPSLRTAPAQLPAGQRRPLGRRATPDSSGCCCLSGHLVPCVYVWWCLSRLLSRLYSLLLLPPPHTPPHNMASSLRRRLRRL